MTNENDKRILELKEQIAAKKEKLGKITKFLPTTNCSIELDSIRFNIQVLKKDELISLLVKLNSYLISAKELGLLNTYVISGYSVEDWVGDIQLKLDNLTKKEEENKLRVMEEKLSKLLSDGKKVELEIDEIASLLKE